MGKDRKDSKKKGMERNVSEGKDVGFGGDSFGAAASAAFSSWPASTEMAAEANATRSWDNSWRSAGSIGAWGNYDAGAADARSASRHGASQRKSASRFVTLQIR